MKNRSLYGRTLYIPQMNYAGSRALAAAFRCASVDAVVSPDSDERTIDLADRYTSGDECYPQRITLGNFLKIAEATDFRPEKTAFYMPTSSGPCRFGQYAVYTRKVMAELGYEDAIVLSPSCVDSYDELMEYGGIQLLRTAWWAVVGSDLLERMLLKTRPHEVTKGDADAVFEKSVDMLCDVIEKPNKIRKRFAAITDALTEARDMFRRIPLRYNPESLLIGIVGEIFCRLNSFSNDELIRKIENLGGRVWLSNTTEWLWYTNYMQQKNLQDMRKRFSKAMLFAEVKTLFQKADEKALLRPFASDLQRYEEPFDIREILAKSDPYIPYSNILGEMVLNLGKAVYLYEKGADGIVDISPFTCMNGNVAQAVYPHVSCACDGIPIKNFYFDGIQANIDRDLEIFMELARSYKQKKVKRYLRDMSASVESKEANRK